MGRRPPASSVSWIRRHACKVARLAVGRRAVWGDIRELCVERGINGREEGSGGGVIWNQAGDLIRGRVIGLQGVDWRVVVVCALVVDVYECDMVAGDKGGGGQAQGMKRAIAEMIQATM